MKKEYVNILVVGYGGKKAKSFRIRKKFLKGAFLGGALSLGSLCVFSIFTFYQNHSLKDELAQVRERKERLELLLAQERERNSRLESYRERVEELEESLIAIDKFLRKKGIRSVRKGVGGASGKIELFNIDYVTFLQKEAETLRKYLTRIPIGPPVWGKVSSRFGYRRDPFSGRYEFHDGVDIKAPWGTPVRATAEGKVIYAGWKAGYGKTVIIRHAYGFKTLYAHLSKIKVKKGRWVKSGQVIGYVGSTGKSTGPHVHYEVWRYSRKQNPIKYMYVRW